MSDTPETDAELSRIEGDTFIFVRDEVRVMANFARRLERERDEARADAKLHRCRAGIALHIAEEAQSERDTLLAANSELVKCLQSIRNAEFQRLSEGMKSHLCQILNRHYKP